MLSSNDRRCESKGVDSDKVPVRRLGFQNSNLDKTNAWCVAQDIIYRFGTKKMKRVKEPESHIVWTQRTSAALSGGIETYIGKHDARLLHYLEANLPQKTFFSYVFMCGKDEHRFSNLLGLE